jgi:hypothetical protein
MGCAKANRTEPKSCLGQVFKFKLGCFVMCTIACHIQAWPSLELKTRPTYHPVSLSLSTNRITLRFCASMQVGFRANVIMTKSHSTDLNIGLE